MDYSTDDYRIEIKVKAGEETYNGDKSTIYCIVNNESGVVEYDDYVLPRIIDTMYELQARLDEVRSKTREQDAPVLELVEEFADGEDSVH